MAVDLEKSQTTAELVLCQLAIRDLDFSTLHSCLVHVSRKELRSVLKTLDEKGLVLNEIIGKKVFYHNTNRFFERLAAKVAKKANYFLDIFRPESSRERTQEKPVGYVSGEFSPILTYYSLIRHGWEVETDNPWKRVKGTSTTKNGDRTLTLYVSSDDKIDSVKLKLNFNREKFKVWRVPPEKHLAYLESVLNNLKGLYKKTRLLNAYARELVNLSNWDSYEIGEVVDLLSQMNSEIMPNAYRSLTDRMFREFFLKQNKSVSSYSNWQKHMEHLHYLQVTADDIIRKQKEMKKRECFEIPITD